MDGYPTVRIDRNFKDANRYALGTEYSPNDKLTLQFGVSFDESPVDDEDRMPDIPVDEIVKTMFGAIYQPTTGFMCTDMPPSNSWVMPKSSSWPVFTVKRSAVRSISILTPYSTYSALASVTNSSRR